MGHRDALFAELSALPEQKAEAWAADILDFMKARRLKEAEALVARWEEQGELEDEVLSDEEQVALAAAMTEDPASAVPWSEVLKQAGL